MEIDIFMSLVPSFKTLSDEKKFIAKVEFLNIMRCITFCQPPYHVSKLPQFPSYSNLPGPSAHTYLYVWILASVKIPSGTHHKFCNDFQRHHRQSAQNPYTQFTSPQHSTSTSNSTPLAHMSPSDGSTSSPLTDSEHLYLHYTRISCGCISLSS